MYPSLSLSLYIYIYIYIYIERERERCSHRSPGSGSEIIGSRPGLRRVRASVSAGILKARSGLTPCPSSSPPHITQLFFSPRGILKATLVWTLASISRSECPTSGVEVRDHWLMLRASKGAKLAASTWNGRGSFAALNAPLPRPAAERQPLGGVAPASGGREGASSTDRAAGILCVYMCVYVCIYIYI